MKLPCKTCITFPVCKQQLHKTLDPPDITTFSIRKKCPPLIEYTKAYVREVDSRYNLYKINAARKFFDLPEIGWHEYDLVSTKYGIASLGMNDSRPLIISKDEK